MLEVRGMRSRRLDRNSAQQSASQATARCLQVFSYHFTDVDELTSFFSYQKLKFIQLTPGKFRSEFLGVKIGDLCITRIGINQAIHALGSKLQQHLSFIVILEGEGETCYSHKLPLQSQYSLFAFDRQRGANLVSPQQCGAGGNHHEHSNL